MHELLENTSATTYIRVAAPGACIHPFGRATWSWLGACGARRRYDGRLRLPLVARCLRPRRRAGAESRPLTRGRSPSTSDSTRSTDSDFVSGGRPGVGGYLQPRHTTIVDDCVRAGVLNGDRESAAIVTLASLFGRRGGSICSVSGQHLDR